MPGPDRYRALRASSAALALVAVGIVVGFFVYNGRPEKRAASELDLQTRRAKSGGIPLTDQEFKRVPVLDSANAAPLYIAAGDTLVKAFIKAKLVAPTDSDGHPIVYVSAPFSPVDLADPAKRKLFDRYDAAAQPAMEITAKAATLPACDFKFAPSQAPTTTFPWLENLKAFARLASCEAAVQSQAGHPVAGLHTIRKYAKVCGHLSQTPNLIHELVRQAIQVIFARTVEAILAVHGREPGVPEAAEVALSSLASNPDFAALIESESIAQLSMMSTLSLDPSHASDADTQLGPEPSNEDEDTRLLRANMREADRARHLPGMIDRWRALQIEETIAYVQAVHSCHDDWLALETSWRAIGTKYTTPHDELHAMMRVGNSDPSNSVDSCAQRISLCRVLLQATAAFQTWNASGKIPDRLQLRGDLARDPLAPRELRYMPGPDGFTIYGVGPRGVDHGGLTRRTGMALTNADIVFTYSEKP